MKPESCIYSEELYNFLRLGLDVTGYRFIYKGTELFILNTEKQVYPSCIEFGVNVLGVKDGDFDVASLIKLRLICHDCSKRLFVNRWSLIELMETRELEESSA